MGTLKLPDRALFFISTLFADSTVFIAVCDELEKKFGSILMESPTWPWDYSEHYSDEMGSKLYRRYLFFEIPIGQDEIAAAKLTTNEIEQRFTKDGNRRINLDPGYLTLAKVVLASTKDYAHRLYLGSGIFAELTLTYQQRKLSGTMNTYRDYLDERSLRMFSLGRRLFPLLFDKEKSGAVPSSVC
ncbi:MAG TPA: DUF4416 family protein [Dissulfurispiraceae bacterium]|nr:DUF4416 family protein [Dissulfurispiraceae bacterium]